MPPNEVEAVPVAAAAAAEGLSMPPRVPRGRRELLFLLRGLDIVWVGRLPPLGRKVVLIAGRERWVSDVLGLPLV